MPKVLQLDVKLYEGSEGAIHFVRRQVGRVLVLENDGGYR